MILKSAEGGSYILSSIRFFVGFYLVYVAYLALFKFSGKAIKNLYLVLAFFIAIRLPGTIMGNYYIYSLGHLLYQIMFIILGILFYVIGSELFIKWCLEKSQGSL
jgi:hypothetical protein